MPPLNFKSGLYSPVQKEFFSLAKIFSPTLDGQGDYPQGWAGKLPRLDDDMITIVRRYPQVRFYILFPVLPNTVCAAVDPQLFPAFLGGRRYLIDDNQTFSNNKININAPKRTQFENQL